MSLISKEAKMKLLELPIGEEFYIVTPYGIQFKYGYPQYLGVIRSQEKMMMFHIKKISEDEYISIDTDSSGMKIDTAGILKEYMFDYSKENLAKRWLKGYEENIQALKDFVNNIPDEDTGEDAGVDVHDAWIKESTLINK